MQKAIVIWAYENKGPSYWWWTPAVFGAFAFHQWVLPFLWVLYISSACTHLAVRCCALFFKSHHLCSLTGHQKRPLFVHQSLLFSWLSFKQPEEEEVTWPSDRVAETSWATRSSEKRENFFSEKSWKRAFSLKRSYKRESSQDCCSHWNGSAKYLTDETGREVLKLGYNLIDGLLSAHREWLWALKRRLLFIWTAVAISFGLKKKREANQRREELQESIVWPFASSYQFEGLDLIFFWKGTAMPPTDLAMAHWLPNLLPLFCANWLLYYLRLLFKVQHQELQAGESSKAFECDWKEWPTWPVVFEH